MSPLFEPINAGNILMSCASESNTSNKRLRTPLALRAHQHALRLQPNIPDSFVESLKITPPETQTLHQQEADAPTQEYKTPDPLLTVSRCATISPPFVNSFEYVLRAWYFVIISFFIWLVRASLASAKSVVSLDKSTEKENHQQKQIIEGSGSGELEHGKQSSKLSPPRKPLSGVFSDAGNSFLSVDLTSRTSIPLSDVQVTDVQETMMQISQPAAQLSFEVDKRVEKEKGGGKQDEGKEHVNSTLEKEGKEADEYDEVLEPILSDVDRDHDQMAESRRSSSVRQSFSTTQHATLQSYPPYVGELTRIERLQKQIKKAVLKARTVSGLRQLSSIDMRSSGSSNLENGLGVVINSGYTAVETENMLLQVLTEDKFSGRKVQHRQWTRKGRANGRRIRATVMGMSVLLQVEEVDGRETCGAVIFGKVEEKKQKMRLRRRRNQNGDIDVQGSEQQQRRFDRFANILRHVINERGDDCL